MYLSATDMVKVRVRVKDLANSEVLPLLGHDDEHVPVTGSALTTRMAPS